MISALDFNPPICDLLIGHEGTDIALPNDGPPLPEAFIASLNDDATHAIKTAYFHVNRGATCVVTDQASELHCPIPTKATCGTAAKGGHALPSMQWDVLFWISSLTRVI
jgi:hypothetical protein